MRGDSDRHGPGCSLRRGGSFVALNALYIGSFMAVLASIFAAFIFQIYFDGAHNDFLEAIVMIVASTLMIFMSGCFSCVRTLAPGRRILIRRLKGRLIRARKGHWA